MFVTNGHDKHQSEDSEPEIIILNEKEGKLEQGSWWWYAFAIPTMYLMTRWVTFKQHLSDLVGYESEKTSILFDRPDTWTRFLIQKSTEWPALDIQYPLTNENFWKFREETRDVLDAVWMKYMLHNQAVRNRFQIVKELLEKNIRELAQAGKDEVVILGLASGSGRDIIDVTERLQNQGNVGTQIQIHLLDYKRSALVKAKELARERGVIDQIDVHQNMIRKERMGELLEIMEVIQPDICYNIGFFDYRADDDVVEMKKVIRRGLSDKGKFISGNIMPNPEMKFLPAVIKWVEMYHRKPEKFGQIMVESGFSDIEIYVEPNEIFAIGVGNTKPR